MRVAGILVCAVVPLGLFGVPDPPGGGLKTPEEWRWRLDAPAAMAPKGEIATGQWWFVAMPPGWHVTMGPGGVVYHPRYAASGRFVVESELFLFPDSSDEGAGIFVGGQTLGEGEEPGYTALLLRKDGAASVARHAGGETKALAAWAAVEGISPHGGKDAEKHAFRVDVETATVTFQVDGKTVAALPRGDIAPEGRFGLRVGRGVNIHVVRLDYTERLAPPRPVKPAA